VPRPSQVGQVTGRARVIARHLVAAEGQGKVGPTVNRGGVFRPSCQCPVEIVRLAHDPPHRLHVGGVVPPGQRQSVCFLRRDKFPLKRLGGPGQHHAGAHHVQPLHLYLVHQLEHPRYVGTADHAAHGVYRFVVVAQHGGFVEIRLLGVRDAEGSQVDAGHRAMGAGQPPTQVLLRQPLPGDGLRPLEATRLEIASGEAPDGIQRKDVHRRAQFMVFLHQGRVSGGPEDGIIGLPVGAAVAHGQGASAGDDQSLQPLAAKDRAQPQPAEVTVGLGDDAGVGDLSLSRPANAHDRPHTGARLPLPQDAAEGVA